VFHLSEFIYIADPLDWLKVLSAIGAREGTLFLDEEKGALKSLGLEIPGARAKF
jgi:hypothetical protein